MRERRPHPFAIAALVCATNFYLGVPAFLALVFGVYARGQIKREPDRFNGKWMANIGVVAGGAFVAFTVFIFLAIAGSIVTCHGGAWPDGCQ